jgi:hypothetical protein
MQSPRVNLNVFDPWISVNRTWTLSAKLLLCSVGLGFGLRCVLLLLLLLPLLLLLLLLLLLSFARASSPQCQQHENRRAAC